MRSARKCQQECIEREFARHAPPNSRTKALRHSSAVPVRRSQRFEQHDNNPSSLPLRYCRNSVASSSSTASMALPHGATTSIRAACAYVSRDDARGPRERVATARAAYMYVRETSVRSWGDSESPHGTIDTYRVRAKGTSTCMRRRTWLHVLYVVSL